MIIGLLKIVGWLVMVIVISALIATIGWWTLAVLVVIGFLGAVIEAAWEEFTSAY